MQNNAMKERDEWKKNKQAHFSEIKREKNLAHVLPKSTCVFKQMKCMLICTVSSYMFKNLMYMKEARRNEFKSWNRFCYFYMLFHLIKSFDCSLTLFRFMKTTDNGPNQNLWKQNNKKQMQRNVNNLKLPILSSILLCQFMCARTIIDWVNWIELNFILFCPSP